MDSLTQGLLGIATFAVVKDKEIGNNHYIIGAIAGSISNLNVLLSALFNNVEFLIVHRSVSHSIGFAVFLSLLLGEILHRIYKKKQSRQRWYLLSF